MAQLPTTPRSSSNGSSGDLPKDAFAKVRYAVFGCGNSDWAATYQSVPRIDRRAIGRAWRAQRLWPRRGRCPQRSRRPVRKMVRGARAGGGQGVRPRPRTSPAAPTMRRCIRSNRWRLRPSTRSSRSGGVAPMKVLGQFRTAEQKRRQCVRTDRPGISRCNCRRGSPTASAIISAWCRATTRRWSIPSRAVSASCRPTRSGCRSPKAAARNCRWAMPSRSGGC